MATAQVLIVESNTTVRKLAAGTLRRAGYSVVPAKNLARGIQLLKDVEPTLVLVDLSSVRGTLSLLAHTDAASNDQRHWIIMQTGSMELPIGLRFKNVSVLLKPFTPARLVELARQHMEPVQLEPGSATTSVEASLSENTRPGEKETLAAIEQDSYLDAWIERLTAELAVVLQTIPAPSHMSSRHLAKLVRQELSERQLRALSHDLRNLTPGVTGLASLEGRIDHAPLVETFQMLQIQGQTGTLNIRQGDHVVNVCLRDGRVDMAVGEAASPEFLLGRYLIEKGVIRRDELERLLHEESNELEQLLGKRLLDKAAISSSDLREALAKQTTDLMCEVLRWDTGTFRFDRETLLPVAELARLELPMQSLLMEGVRRIDEWTLIHNRIPDLGVVYTPTAAQEDDLEPEEQRVLQALDGRRDVHALIDTTSMSTFEVCKTLCRFVDRGLVRPVNLQ